MFVDNPLIYGWVSLGTTVTFISTAIGAAFVFFLKKINPLFKQISLGFSGGIMIAASIWSLIIPSIEQASKTNIASWIPAAIGIVVGTIFLLGLDKGITYLQNKPLDGKKTRFISIFKKNTINYNEAQIVHINEENQKILEKKYNVRKSTLLMTSITIHNVPEGMAVGLSIMTSFLNDSSLVNVASFLPLMIGIGIQNVPEGAAVSFSLRQNGMSRWKSFLYGALSGIVEPIGGIFAVLIVGWINNIMPYVLSFSAGAMICVVINELVPEFCNTEANQRKGFTNISGITTFMIGFLLMMILDIALAN